MPTNNTQFYGTNKGAAQVIDNSGVDNAFGGLLVKQQQQRQLELKQLTDQQAQLKPDGLRNDADRQDFFNQTQNWRQRSIDAMNESDPYKKSLLKSQADQAYMGAQNTIAKSKQAAATWAPIANILADPTKRYEYDDNAVKEFTANNQRGVNDAAYNPNPFTLKSAPDIDYFNKNTKAINDGLINNAVKTTTLSPISKDGVGNPIQYQTEGQRIDPMAENGLAHQIANRASFINGVPVDARYFNALKARNSDLFGNVQTEDDMHNAINLAAAREAHSGQLYKPGASSIYKNSSTDDDKYELFKKEQLFRQLHPSYAVANNQAPNTVQNYVSDMYNGNQQAGKTFASLIPNNGFKQGEQPDFNIVNGKHILTIPAEYDPKTLNQMNVDKQRYALSPQKQGGILGFGGTPIPYEQSDAFTKNQGKYVPKKSAQTIELPRTSDVDYRAKAIEVANNNGIPVSAINEEGGGHNQAIQQKIKQVKPQVNSPVTP